MELSDIACKVWGEQPIELSAFCVEDREIRSYCAPSYLIIGDFLFTVAEETEKHGDELSSISDQVITCWMTRSVVGMAEFADRDAIHTQLDIRML